MLRTWCNTILGRNRNDQLVHGWIQDAKSLNKASGPTVLPPQLSEGTTWLTNPGIPGTPHGKVATWLDGGTTYELWEIPDWSKLSGATSFEFSGSDPLPTSNWGTKRITKLNAAATGSGAGRYALMPLDYGVVPTLGEINAANISRRLRGEEWEVTNGPAGGPFGSQVGALWRIRYTPPGDTRQWQTDHWVLYTAPPHVYDYPSATNAARVTRTATNVRLLFFLRNAAQNHANATYVAVDYPLIPYKPSLVP